jgi:hypothetical protein
MSLRLQVIEEAIRVEEMIAHNICVVIGIEPGSSKLFGHSAGSLPFNVKINLLQEVQYFDKETKDKFARFAEIRNKFAHVSSVINYTSCFERLDGILKNLKHWYPKNKREDFDTDERYYFGFYYSLLNDVFFEVSRFNQYIANKVDEEFKKNWELRWYEEHLSQLEKIKTHNPEVTTLLDKAEVETNKSMDSMPPFPKSKWLEYLFESKKL